MPTHPIREALFARLLALTMLLFMTACGTPAANTESDNNLAEAGFVAKKANTAERMAAIRALPPHQFVMRTHNGQPRYLYADPTGCSCIFVGDQTAYDRYRQRMAAAQTATDDQVRAILSSSPLPGEAGL